MRRPLYISAAVAAAVSLGACSPQDIKQPVTGSLQVSSTSIAAGAIPDEGGCKGAGSSPQLTWTDPPAGTRSFALIMDDKDEVVGRLQRHYFVHWLAFDLPAEKRELPAALPRQALPDGTQQGKNDVREFGYSGPCPKPGVTDHYAFTIYALDTKLGLPVETTGRQLLTAIDGHILARGQLVGTYSK